MPANQLPARNLAANDPARAEARSDVELAAKSDESQKRAASLALCCSASKDVMSSLSAPTCRDLLSSSAERVRAGLVTVELEEAPCEHRNGT